MDHGQQKKSSFLQEIEEITSFEYDDDCNSCPITLPSYNKSKQNIHATIKSKPANYATNPQFPINNIKSNELILNYENNSANNALKLNELENAVIGMRFEIQQQTLNTKNNLSNSFNRNYSALKTDIKKELQTWQQTITATQDTLRNQIQELTHFYSDLSGKFQQYSSIKNHK